ncbi:MAG: small multi-drug export protein [Oscillospiraceae bacterium]|jgi:uncharacterized membrane protein|nr:small multi-drug export protein [Oscillospiraceae bacterium]
MSFLSCSLITFLIAAMPVVELRGAIPYGVAHGLPHLFAAALAVAGNLLPAPFIIIFARRVLAWMKRKSPRLRGIAEMFERKAEKNKKALNRGITIGLMLFVALPLPGTGAWTGSLIAAVFDIRLRSALPAVAAGVALAAALVTGLAYGFGSLAGSIPG